MNINANWLLLFVIIWCYFIIPRNGRFMMNVVKRKKKGVKRKMPIEMMREFIGKECTIALFNDAGGVRGKILAIEENWIKVEEKKKIRIINGDMIRDIATEK